VAKRSGSRRRGGRPSSRAAAWRRRLAAALERARRLPPAAWTALALLLLVCANAVYQVGRKPTELVGLVTPASPKPPAETWRAYGGLFREHATAAVRPELLAALVQAESSGDPVALPDWRLRLTADPRYLYAPPSSAVGLLQMTDGNYERARRLCVHDHEVAREGPWWDPRGCFLNGLYVRTVPGHAIEMTSAYLDVELSGILARPGVRRPTAAERDALLAAVHLCGPERAAGLAQRGYRAAPGERCGEQDLAAYLARVRGYALVFAALAADR